MKHVPSTRGSYLLVSAAAVCALAVCRPVQPPPPPPPPDAGCTVKGPTLTEANSGGSVALAGDELVTLELETRYSSGYGWTVSRIDPAVLKLAGREYVFGSAPGQPDKQILRFAGVAQGTSTLSVTNGRPWEGGTTPPVRTFEASVSVSGPYTGCYQPPAGKARAPQPPVLSPVTLPSEFIYCDEGSCTPVKDQGACGSSWAFATTGALEQIVQKVDGVTRDLSEQHLVSCNTSGYSCLRGGWDGFPWYYDTNDLMGEIGTAYEEDFPYAAADVPCSLGRPRHERIDSWEYFREAGVEVLKQALYDNGPLWVTVCVDDDFIHYSGGIFTGRPWTCANHAVVLTGWNDNINAWLLRNSWGEIWGVHGYMWISYSRSGVGFMAVSPRYTSKAVPAVQVAAGNESSFVLQSDGTLWAAGANNYGQLGTGDTRNQPTFVRVLTGVSSVAAGLQNTLVVKDDGTLWATGRNQYGQLGTGDTDNRYSFVQVLDGGVSSVAAGGDHTLVVRSDGTLWGAGYNGDGQLGDGTMVNRAEFLPAMVEVNEAQFEPLTGIWKAAASGRHSLALKTDGTLWASGANNYGQLGTGDTGNRRSFRQVLDGGVSSVAAGAYHSVALMTDGTVQTTGWNAYGQLGDGTTTSRSRFAQVQDSHVSSVAAGSFNTVVRKDNGTVWGAGDNTHGQLGNDGTANQLSFGPSREWDRQVQALSDVTDVGAARNHTLVVKSDGTVWATGSNAYGQLGDGTTTERWIFERVLLP